MPKTKKEKVSLKSKKVSSKNKTKCSLTDEQLAEKFGCKPLSVHLVDVFDSQSSKSSLVFDDATMQQMIVQPTKPANGKNQQFIPPGSSLIKPPLVLPKSSTFQLQLVPVDSPIIQAESEPTMNLPPVVAPEVPFVGSEPIVDMDLSTKVHLEQKQSISITEPVVVPQDDAEMTLNEYIEKIERQTYENILLNQAPVDDNNCLLSYFDFDNIERNMVVDPVSRINQTDGLDHKIPENSVGNESFLIEKKIHNPINLTIRVIDNSKIQINIH